MQTNLWRFIKDINKTYNGQSDITAQISINNQQTQNIKPPGMKYNDSEMTYKRENNKRQTN